MISYSADAFKINLSVSVSSSVYFNREVGIICPVKSSGAGSGFAGNVGLALYAAPSKSPWKPALLEIGARLSFTRDIPVCKVKFNLSSNNRWFIFNLPESLSISEFSTIPIRSEYPKETR